MTGFLQILIYMLCVYFIFKGFEIFQIGLANQTDQRKAAIIIGILAIVAAIGAAVAFFFFEEYYAAEFGNKMNSMPTLKP